MAVQPPDDLGPTAPQHTRQTVISLPCPPYHLFRDLAIQLKIVNRRLEAENKGMPFLAADAARFISRESSREFAMNMVHQIETESHQVLNDHHEHMRSDGSTITKLNRASMNPRRQIDQGKVVPILGPTPVFIQSGASHPAEDGDDADYVDGFSLKDIRFIVFMLRRILPHHVAHHTSDHNPSKKVHVKSPIPGRIIDPLRRLMPELWEDGEAFDTHLFGCPDCDIMGQILEGIAWLYQNKRPQPTKAGIDRPALKLLVESIIRNRVPLADFYRLAATYCPDNTLQKEIIATNEEWAWTCLRKRMADCSDLWWFGTITEEQDMVDESL